MATINLTIYIDERALAELQASGYHLGIGRSVNNNVNVVFATVGALGTTMTFQWVNLYAIAALPMGSVKNQQVVVPTTTFAAIAPGQACVWTRPNDEKDMPVATAAPLDFPPNTFGTVDKPAHLQNTIWLASSDPGASGHVCLSVDNYSEPTPGSDEYIYKLDDDYVVSWEPPEVPLSGPSIYMQHWSNPWVFKFPHDLEICYLSFAINEGKQVWAYYGPSNPGRHDPSKEIPDGIRKAGDLVKRTSTDRGI